MAPRASVIVPHLDQPQALRLCLAALSRQTLARAEFEVIVADNGSADKKALSRALAALPGCLLVFAREKGAAHARNAALAAARGQAIAFIDADCVAEPCWLEEGLTALLTSDLVGGEIRVTPSDARAPTPVEAFETVFAFRQRAYVHDMKFSATANLFATRRTVGAVGSFRHGISEDVDWCRRARALGFRLAFNATSIVSHPARRDYPALVRKWERLVAERWTGFEGRNPGRRLKWAALAAATALSAAPHAVAVLTTKRLRFKDRIAAAGVLARIRWWRARRMMALLSA